MIRAVDYQKIDMNDEEWAYYQDLVKKFSTDKIKGSDYFRDLFSTDEKGIITIIRPTKPIPYDVMFFIQNLMINQHLGEFDARLARLEAALGKE